MATKKKQQEPVTVETTGYILTRLRGEDELGEIIVASGNENGELGLELVEEGAGERIFIPEDVVARVIDRMQVLHAQLQERAKES